MVTVYRPDGVEEEKEAVDARECVRHCGYRYGTVAVDAAVEGQADGSGGPTDPAAPQQAGTKASKKA